MPVSSKHRKEHAKGIVVRVVSLGLAVLMILSVILATVWKW